MTTPRQPLTPFRRTVLSLSIASFLGQPLLASAEIVADAAAGARRPVVETTANGLPLVQITAPSAAGVSHNQYQRFDVEQKGAIINNAGTLTQTLQAGFVPGNPNLAGGPARIILNEVTSTSPSLLQGYLEVAGSRAEVVLANPNGITCNGCGFINTSRGVLATGTPVIGAAGSLDALRVSGGQIAIGGAGLDATGTDRLDLIARAVSVNAELWANQLNVIAGTNRVGYADLGVQPVAGEGARPAVAIDVAALGGMYAGRIRLVGTEAGVGVNLVGTAVAQSGDFTLDAAGRLTVTGTTGAAGRLAVTAQEADLRGALYGQNGIRLDTAGAVANSGTLDAGGDLTVNAASLDNRGGRMAQQGEGRVAITLSGALDNRAGLIAGSDASISAASIDNRAGTLAADRDATIQAATLANGGGRIVAGRDLALTLDSHTLTADQTLAGTRSTTIATTGDLTLPAGESWNAAAPLTLAAGATLGLAGRLAGRDDLALRAATVDVTATGQVVSDRALTVEATGAIANAGELAGQSVSLAGASLDNRGGILASGDLDATVSGTTTNRGAILAGQDLRFRLGTLANEPDAEIWAGRHLTLEGQTPGSRAAAITNDRGRIEAHGGDLVLRAETLANQGALPAVHSEYTGTIYHPWDTYPDWRYRLVQQVYRDVLDPGFVARPGQLLAGGNLLLDGQTIRNTMGQIAAAGNVNITGGSFDNTGRVLQEIIHQGTQVQQDEEDCNWYGDCDHYWEDRRFDWMAPIGPRPYAAVPSSVSAGGALTGNLAGGITNDAGAPALQTRDPVRASGLATPNIPTALGGGIVRDASGRLDFSAYALPAGTRGLFVSSPDPRYLVEANPRFARLSDVLSSDWFLERLSIDPQRAQKRLGDGYLEQRLVQDQLAGLTGRRSLSGQSGEAQYRALMEAGVAYAKAHQLSPGISLSAEQMAQLTSDLVWLETRKVAGQDVLVPIVYLAAARPNDLQANGALIIADRIELRAGNGIDSSGAIVARNELNLAAGTLATHGGTLAAGRLDLAAQEDLNLSGTRLDITGDARLTAGRDLTLGAETTRHRSAIVFQNMSASQSGETRQGIDARIGGTLAATAGRDLATQGAALRSEGRIDLQAGRDLHIAETASTLDSQYQAQSSRRETFSRKTVSETGQIQSETVQGSTLSGDSISATAGRDLTVRGSALVGQRDVSVAAGRDLALDAAQAATRSDQSRTESQSGLFGTGGVGVTLGRRSQRDDSRTATVTQIASTVGSVEGNLILEAGKAYSQTGSELLAPQGDIAVTAQRIDIAEAREASRSQTESRQSQSGLTLALTSPVISAVQTARQMSKAAGQTKDSRLKALAGATTALAGKNAYDAVAANPSQAGGINISLSIGASQSQSNTEQTSDTAAGSTVTAGGNVHITARGAGQDSDLTVQGSTVKAGHDATLKAEGDLNLLAAQNTAELHSTNKNASASVGVSFGTDGLLFTVAASGGRGKANGSDRTWSNTHVEAGNQLMLESGGDTAMKGAVVKGAQVTADIGGNLDVESLQDTSQYDSKQQSIGGSVSFGYGRVGGNFNFAQSKIDSTYASVSEQSGIQAGDGGFQINVKGNTALKGAVIASADKAVREGKNSFHTGGTLTLSDIENKASYSADSVGVNLGAGTSVDGKLAPSGTSAGFGTDGGNAASTTRSGISGIAGNRGARTGDAATGIARIFDADQVRKEVDAQTQITQAFGQRAAQAIGDYAAAQTREAAALRDQADKESDPDRIRQLKAQAQALEDRWGENGTLRLAAHTLVGGLTGGASGAAGAAAGTLTAPQVAKALDAAGVDPALAQTLTAIASTAAGAAVGGTAGAGTAFNEVTNNYLKHQEIRDIAKARKECKGGNGSPAACSEVARLEALDKQRNATLVACEGDNSQRCASARQEVRAAYAEIIRKSDEQFGILTPRPLGYDIEAGKTQFEADKTISTVDRAKGSVVGFTGAILGGLADLAKGGVIYAKAVAGDEEAGDQLGKAVDGAIKLASSPELWGKILENATRTQRARIADAYEKGDGEALGKIAGEVLSNFVGGGVGTVGKAGKAAKGVEDVVKRAGAETRGVEAGSKSAQLAKQADEFEKSLVSLPPGERVATVKQAAIDIAESNGWQKDGRLSRINDRDVYRAEDGSLYSLDTQHGRFEKINPKTGNHEGEYRVHDLKPISGSIDKSGKHDLRLK